MVVQRDRARVRRPHLEEDALDAVPAREVDQPHHEALAVALLLLGGLDRDVEQVRFARSDRQHTVAHDLAAGPREHPAAVARAQAVVAAGA